MGMLPVAGHPSAGSSSI